MFFHTFIPSYKIRNANDYVPVCFFTDEHTDDDIKFIESQQLTAAKLSQLTGSTESDIEPRPVNLLP